VDGFAKNTHPRILGMTITDLFLEINAMNILLKILSAL